jgi:hypothetical protein
VLHNDKTVWEVFPLHLPLGLVHLVNNSDTSQTIQEKKQRWLDIVETRSQSFDLTP